jgi:hypothetical protein
MLRANDPMAIELGAKDMREPVFVLEGEVMGMHVGDTSASFLYGENEVTAAQVRHSLKLCGTIVLYHSAVRLSRTIMEGSSELRLA